MSKYSSDSDSSRDRRRHTVAKSKRARSSSSSSSTSHSYQKKSYKHKHSRGRRSRSRSKSRYTKSKHQHSHLDSGSRAHSSSSSKSQSRKTKHKIYRSKSRERLRSRSKDRSWKSRSRSNSKQRSPSHSKDSSRHRSKSSSPDKFRLRSSPSLKGESGLVKHEPSTEEQLRAKLQKAIKAAQSADDQLRQQGLLSSSNSTRKDEIVKVSASSESSAPEPLESILDEINDASFVPKHFCSSKSTSQVLVNQPSTDIATPLDTNSKLLRVLEEPQSIFHSSLFLDPEQKLDKWVKKLFHLRQKAINGEPLT